MLSTPPVLELGVTACCGCRNVVIGFGARQRGLGLHQLLVEVGRFVGGVGDFLDTDHGYFPFPCFSLLMSFSTSIITETSLSSARPILSQCWYSSTARSKIGVATPIESAQLSIMPK